MNFYHLTHLASVLSRIPLVAPFSVSRDGSSTARTPVPFSALFDMSRFSQLTSVTAIDWNDIRPVSETRTEELGCWIGATSAAEVEERAKAMQDNGIEASFFPMGTSKSLTPVGDANGDELMGTSILGLCASRKRKRPRADFSFSLYPSQPPTRSSPASTATTQLKRASSTKRCKLPPSQPSPRPDTPSPNPTSCASTTRCTDRNIPPPPTRRRT
jgi:hypothetical protein